MAGSRHYCQAPPRLCFQKSVSRVTLDVQQGLMKMKNFDLIEYQREARERRQPSTLFQLWEEVCRLYERGLIGKYELEEMKGVIWPNLRAICALRTEVEATFNSQAA